MRAGSLRQRSRLRPSRQRSVRQSRPSVSGGRQAADVVRVIWPSGTLQAETDGRPQRTVTELDRKPSSCPYLYVWNGSRFEFLTDFLGGGEIGYWQRSRRVEYSGSRRVRAHPPRPAPAARLPLRAARHERARGSAVRRPPSARRHRSSTKTWTSFRNEGLGAPNAGHFPPATVRDARPLVAAMDERGRDVSDRLAALDRRYVDGFTDSRHPRIRRAARAPSGLGPGEVGVVLLATGWTSYAFSSDNVAAHHRGLKLEPPGRSRCAPVRRVASTLGSIGIPVGRPQTIVVDLAEQASSGRARAANHNQHADLLGSDSRGHIGGGLRHDDDPARSSSCGRCGGAASRSRSTPDRPAAVTIRLRSGDPRVAIWKTMIGRYTREGDVRELLTKVDDMFVIARPGDEIALVIR